jgi:hypothetical protein
MPKSIGIFSYRLEWLLPVGSIGIFTVPPEKLHPIHPLSKVKNNQLPMKEKICN